VHIWLHHTAHCALARRFYDSALISQSHGRGLVSHSPLCLILSDLPSQTTGGFNPFWKG